MISLRSLAIVVLAVLPFGAVAQDLDRIQGTVTDATGGVIIGAVVSASAGGSSNITQTNERGEYELAGLGAGEFELNVTYAGFAPASRRVRIPGSGRVDFVLEVAIATQVAVAAGDGHATSAGAMSTLLLTGPALAALPPDPMRMMQRLRDIAGVTGGPGDLVVYVDGFPQALRVPPPDAIQTIRISRNPLAAEFADPGRTLIDIITKPPAGRYFGEARFNFNDAALNARNAFAPRSAPVQTRNYSGYLSGPIVPARWSFVLYAGRWAEQTGEVINATMVDPVTGQQARFVQEVPSSSRIDNIWLGTDHLVGANHTMAWSYGRTREETPNQGLSGGLDLPERSFAAARGEHVARLALVSVYRASVLHEARIGATRTNSSAQASVDAPAVLVLDAFHGGGNQEAGFRNSRATLFQIVDHLTFARGKSTYKAGVAVDVVSRRDLDRSQFGGTFIFGTDVERDARGFPVTSSTGASTVLEPIERYRRTQLGWAGYGPSQFSIVRGDPNVGLSQWASGAFFQSDWMPASALTMSYGLRHELQSHVRAGHGLAPRAAVAWAPDGRGTLRGGLGVFYHRLPADMLLETVRLDGRRQQRFALTEPRFFRDIPGELPLDAIEAPAMSVVSGELRAAASVLATIGYERQLHPNLFASAHYSYDRGAHLLRVRDVNAPVGGRRPGPEYGGIFQFESTGRSRRHELATTLRTSWTGRLTAFATYVLASARSDTDGYRTMPADSYDLSPEFGWSAADERHRATLAGTASLPGQVFISLFANVASGRPFNITTGRDTNGDTAFTERPALADPSDRDAIQTPFGWFKTNAGPGDAIVPRNLGRGTAHSRVDLHVSKGVWTGASERAKVTITADVVNVFNRVNVTGFNGVVTAPAFGTPQRAVEPRRIELSVGVNF